MKSFKRGMLILSVFLVGCFTATVVQPLVVPVASAQQADLPKYEYQCVAAHTGGNTSEQMAESQTTEFNRFGQEGWDMVGLTLSATSSQVVCFKRQL